MTRADVMALAVLVAIAGSVSLPAMAREKARPAQPAGNIAERFPQDAYPDDARRARQQGKVAVRLVIDPSGKPIACAVEVSGGVASLDNRTCELALQNGRFTPALDDDGKPIEGWFQTPRVAWLLDTAGSLPADVFVLGGTPIEMLNRSLINARATVVDIDEEGRALTCSSSPPATPDPCLSIPIGSRVAPPVMRGGKPVAGRVTITASVAPR